MSVGGSTAGGNHSPAVLKQRLIIEQWRVKNNKLERIGRKDELIKHLH